MNRTLFEYKDETYLLKVENMNSAHCLVRVENAALLVEGVYQARAHLSSGIAEITGGEPQLVAAAVTEAGYPACLMTDT